MVISNDEILNLVLGKLSQEQIKQSFIYWDRRARPRGDPIKIGPQTFEMPFDGTMVFVDFAPRANWAHPCLYVFVNVETNYTQILEASFPPNIDPTDKSYIIILRFGKQPPHERYFSAFDK